MAQVIQGVLKEELANSLRMRLRYEGALRKLGKGSLVAKRIRGRPYYYLASREGRRVRFRYLGKLSEEERNRWEVRGRQRRQYRGLLREVKEQIRFLERSLRG